MMKEFNERNFGWKQTNGVKRMVSSLIKSTETENPGMFFSSKKISLDGSHGDKY